MKTSHAALLRAWAWAVGAMGAAYLALRALQFGPGMPRIMLTLAASGVAFVASAIYVRRRFGGGALAVWCIVGAAILALAQGRVIADKMDLVEYSLGAWTLFALLAPAFLVVGATLHRMARREFRPALQRDFPVCLAVFAIAEVLSFGLVLVLLVIATPRIG